MTADRAADQPRIADRPLTEAGRLCQALVVRLAEGIDGPDRVPSRLAERVRLATGTWLWVQDVPAPAESEMAARRRERELSRAADPQSGPGVRVVLLRFADAAELAVVAHRAVVADPCSVVRAVLTNPVRVARADADLAERLSAGLASLDRVKPPYWGLGRPGVGTVGTHLFSLGEPDGALDDVTPEDHTRDGATPATVALTAALGLVLARCTGQQRVEVGLDPVHTAEFGCAADTTVSGYLADVSRALEHPVTDATPAVGLTVTPAGAARPFLDPVHPLSIWLSDPADPAGGMGRGGCHYRHSAFDPAVVDRFMRMLGTAHRSLAAAAPDAPVGALALFDDRHLAELAHLGGLGHALSVPDQRIHELVRAHALASPDEIALCFERQRLSYRELDERANRAAHGLRAAGVRTGDRVGVCLERSLDLVVMLLAVLKAGAAYVPMDTGHPAERLSYTVTDAGLEVVITGSAGFPEVSGVRLLHPDKLASGDWPATPPEDGGSAGDAAYVIYTSGSTGRPKGVVVPHRNVLSLLAATRDGFGFTRSDVWTLFHSSAFDFSVWEIWGCLGTGGRLVVVPHWTSREPERFAELLHAEQVSVLNQTPSAFSQLNAVDRQRPLPASLRLVIFGGEPLDTRPLRSWFDRHPGPGCRLVNMFGITETTVHVTAQTVGRAAALAGSRSVGRPLPGWHLSVHDPDGRPVPPGVPGEIYVGGAGVAAGYLHRPELTAQRFVADPHASGPRYRSGDRGRLLPDGRLEHLGRLDNQVKLRGFRIELDEIRARLLDAPGVGAAAVLLRHGSAGKDGSGLDGSGLDGSDAAAARLDGYVVLSGGATVEQVREHAARFLPEHMVPSTLTALPALPLTANGKLDAARLPEPVGEATRGLGGLIGDAVDDVTGASLEARLQAVWQQVFGFRVGLDDDFFTLGGNSLLGVQLFAAMRSAGLPTPPLRQLYLNRTVRSLAAVLQQA